MLNGLSFEDLYVERILCLSTGHLPSGTAINEIEAYSAEYAHGFIVYMDEDWFDAPDWYKQIVAFAKKHGVKWVRFDCDALDHDDLQKFDW